MAHKFKIGDVVKIVRGGMGVAGNEKGEYTITEIGIYKNSIYDGYGYKVFPLIGNSKTGKFDGFIGEPSFELVKTGPPLKNPFLELSVPEKQKFIKSILEQCYSDIKAYLKYKKY